MRTRGGEPEGPRWEAGDAHSLRQEARRTVWGNQASCVGHRNPWGVPAWVTRPQASDQMRPGVSAWGWRALLSLVVITAPNPVVRPWSSLDVSASGHKVELPPSTKHLVASGGTLLFWVVPHLRPFLPCPPLGPWPAEGIHPGSQGAR